MAPDAWHVSRQALRTLLTEGENNRNSLWVVLAGYRSCITSALPSALLVHY